MKELSIVNVRYRSNATEYFERFSAEPWACLLDSCTTFQENQVNSRYDIITSAPWTTLTVATDGQITINNRLNDTSESFYNDSPLDVLSDLLQTMTPVNNQNFPFTGGALGFWGYELASVIEPGRIFPRQSELPVMAVGLYHWALITDHHSQETYALFHPDINNQQKSRILTKLDKPQPSGCSTFSLKKSFRASTSREHYQKSFDTIQSYIISGDCYEVNLTQEFSGEFEGSSWSAYKALREASPAPYSAYLTIPELDLLSHSPERFIKMDNRHVSTHPIKGTRPRGQSPNQDIRLANELLSSQKDQSENLMIVDLLRNDLGRVCKTGSIQVPRLFDLESYANVHHLVSTVTGELQEQYNAFDLLKSTFPGGSITGAPKIRSMEIIRELEPHARQAYCGAIGYVSCNGKMDTNIAIRTMLAHKQNLFCWGGGAVIADSDCEDEYQESITKVKNLMTTLEALSPKLRRQTNQDERFVTHRSCT